jgi:hypothetical protein
LLADLQHLAELFGFEVFDNFLGKNIRVRKILGLFEAFVLEPRGVEAGLVAVLRPDVHRL